MHLTHKSHLDALWQGLIGFSKLAFSSQASKPSSWNGSGQGAISIEQPDEHSIVFRETGTWQSNNGLPGQWNNIWQWSRYPSKNTIGLTHLRFGIDKPVYLFELVAQDAHLWQASHPHSCGKDSYTASISLRKESITMRWSIQGPHKNATLHYRYW